MSTLKTLLRSSLLLALIFGSIVSFEEVRELSVQYVASKAHPLKIKGRTVCSTSQVDYKGHRFTLTNQHCCRALRRVDPKLKKNEDFIGKLMTVGEIPREILYINEKHDLCLLEPDLNSPSFSLARKYKINEPVNIVGHPRGLKQTIRPGRIVQDGFETFPWISPFRKSSYFLASVIGYPGNSGSPIVDRFGQLVGVAFAGSRTYHTEILVVPVGNVREFLDRVVSE